MLDVAITLHEHNFISSFFYHSSPSSLLFSCERNTRMKAAVMSLNYRSGYDISSAAVMLKKKSLATMVGKILQQIGSQ